MAEGVRAKRWPAADGRVRSSGVIRTVDTEKGREKYAPGVVYDYEVAGKPYRGARVTACDWSSTSKSACERVVAPYKAGAVLPVYYDPAKPERSLLEPGVPLFAAVGAACCLFMAGIAGASALGLLR